MGVEETAKLIVEAEAKGFAETDSLITRTEGSLAALTAGYKAGTFPLDYYMERGAKLQSELDRLTAAYKMADEAVKKYGSTHAASAALTEQALKGTGNAAYNSTERFRGLAYAANDFFAVQGGIQNRLNAIANNLPQLFAGMGPKMVNFGLALGAIAPIVGVLIANFDTLKKEFGFDVAEMLTEVDRLKKRIKELEDKPVKLAVDSAELDAAKAKLKELTDAQAEWDAGQKHQSVHELAAGKEVTKALDEEPGGEKEVEGDVKADLVKQFRESSLPLKKSQASVAALAQLAEEARVAWSQSKEPEVRAQLAEAYRKYVDDVRAETDEGLKIERAITVNAEQVYGHAKKRAKDANALDQQAGREELAELVAKTGRTELAKKILASTAAEAKWWKEAEESAKFIAHEEELEAAHTTKINAARKVVQEDALGELLKSKELDDENDALAKAVNAKGLTHLESFQQLKDLIHSDITASLKKSGIDLTKAEEMTAKAAAAEAEQAFARVGREGQKDAKGKKKSDTKTANLALDEELDEMLKDATEFEKRNKAEANRIQAKSGKDTKEVFAQRVAASPLEDPEKVAAKVAGEMALEFTKSRRLGGMGASQGGALVAAQENAAQAGFHLTLPQVRAAAVAATRDAKAPQAVAARDARNQEAQATAEDRAAEKAQRAELNQQGRRGRAVLRPKRGKTPMPKAKPVAVKVAPAKPKLQQPATEAEVFARRAAERKAQLTKPGDESPASKAAMGAKFGPQANLAPAVSGTQDAMAATQAVQAANLAIVAALNLRVRTLETNARQMLTRASEQQPTASGSGSPVA